ncbi:ribonuclease Z [Dactylosporangium matsuzakiense]|uniref:Ribonuclease Z n=1 Tax=Dactylosporangium matsuzakiense TaxID=53360 RepID=A0A9W6KMW3_9ACTN|nr:ribonuclease Z [Dactylosporangium matsuzakiense]UWZ41961.1 ribonuclease Z [Dactylosporangium matsuzakiense]GLL04967.1 ribonuclease Z [Dactylosporangium matsuzakiense]
MSLRELVVLGTASQVPTRARNHNGYFLAWDGEGILFDPGDGTQRQMVHAGVSASAITRIGLTHFHGDHCLGLPGVVQRISLDGSPHDVQAYFPGSGEVYFDRLRHASPFYDVAKITKRPVTEGGLLAETARFRLEAQPLDHGIEAYGYRLVEPDGRRMLPDRLRAHGIAGPDVAVLQRQGELGGVRLEDVSEPRRGQRFAFVMDTRLCPGVFALAEGADVLVIESTYLTADEDLAVAHGHLTAGQAARVAAESGVGTLVLTHFSQRYDDLSLLQWEREAAAVFDGEVVVATDLTRVRIRG